MGSIYQKKTQFLNPGKEFCQQDKSKIVVLPFPLEQTTSYMKGTVLGPEAIVEASCQVEFFDPELKFEARKNGIYTDWSIGDPEINKLNIEEILKKANTAVQKYLDEDRFILTLGGEHTIIAGIFDPFAKKYKGDLTVVHLDAHSDLKDEYEGTPYSHASAIRRIYKKAPILAAGIRSVDQEEFALGRNEHIHTYYAHEMEDSTWVKDLVSRIKTQYVYFTIDLDGLDPSIMPSVGTPEPGGILWPELMGLLRGVSANHKIIGADVNELRPIPNFVSSDFIAAKLCYKIMGFAMKSQNLGIVEKFAGK